MTDTESESPARGPTHIHGEAARFQFFSVIARSGLLFVFQWLVARAYGAGPFGVVSLAQTGTQAAAMLGRAAGDIIVLRGPPATPDANSQTLAVGITVSLVGGLIAAVGLFAWGVTAIGVRLGYPIAPPFLLAAVTVPLTSIAFPLAAGLQRAGRFRSYSLVATSVDPVVRNIAFLAGLLVGAHWLFALSSATLGAAAAVLVGLWSLGPSLRRLRPTLRLGAGRKALVFFCLTTTVATSAQAALPFVALSLLALLGYGADTGPFAAATRIAMLSLWIQTALAAPFLPRIADRVRHGGAAASDLDQEYRQVIAAVLWVNGPLLLGLVVAAKPVLGLFGPEFTRGAGVLALLAASQWVNSATALAEDFLPLSGRSQLALLNNLGQLAFVAICGYLLGKKFGMLGIAIAYATAVTLVNTVRAAQLRRLFNVSLPLGTITKYGACWAITAAVTMLLATGQTFVPSQQVLLAIGAALACGTLMLVVSSHDERRALSVLIQPGR